MARSLLPMLAAQLVELLLVEGSLVPHLVNSLLCPLGEEERKGKELLDSEFKAALIATLNLKKEWMASVDKREKELGIR